MKRILYTLFLLVVFFQQSNSQFIGEWEALLSYYNTVKVAETNNYVFAVAKGAQIKATDNTTETGGALFCYGKEDNSIKLYSRQDGLSDQQITLIGYNPEVNTLLIVYNNGNLDLFSENNIYNIPYLKNSTTINNKTINDISFYNEFAYLSGEFGIMVVNIKKKEITDTYKVNRSVISTCIKDNYLYAVTNNGIIKGLMSKNLLDTNNWESHPVASLSDDIQQIALYQNYLCFNVKNKGVYYQKEDGTTSPVIEDSNINKIKIENNKLIAFTSNKAYIFSSLTQKDVVNTGTINDISSLKDNIYWIAAGRESLKGIKRQNDQYGVIFTDTITANNCPKCNLCEFMTTDNEKLFVAGGGRWADRNNYYGTFMIYYNGFWTNYDENIVAQQAGTNYFRDVTSIAIDSDPQNENHYFASTWGEGLYEFKDNKCIKLYNQNNSSLESAWNNSPHHVRIEGLCFDKDNNLWMTNTGAKDGNIKVLRSDGTWCSLANDNQYLRNADLIDKILITSNGLKWINVLRTTSGIFILDDNGTIDDTSDDTSKFFTSLINLSDKKEITTRAFYCMAEDKEGSVYLGTGNGVMICPSSYNLLQNEQLYANRIIRTTEDGTPIYFLDGEQVNAIAVDGGNRKWIGTENSGVFLVNEDASETIYNFTTDNSPLLSNTIKSITIDHINGKVYFGTDKGIISYAGEATKGSENYSNVYAYPNPVRPDYSKVTIAGLMENSNVKITDLNGNLIYQGKSLGGQLTWNCRNRSGRRVASGVYLVLAATQDSKESIVTKIAVIK